MTYINDLDAIIVFFIVCYSVYYDYFKLPKTRLLTTQLYKSNQTLRPSHRHNLPDFAAPSSALSAILTA